MSQPEGGALPLRTKAIYALGDHTVNLGLSAMLFLFPVFLTDTALLPPPPWGGFRLRRAGAPPVAGPTS